MDLAFLRPVTFDDWVNLALLPERVIAGCEALHSALGVLLASVGLFGAVSYSVSERRRELGIRTALGAQPRQLLIMILRQTAVIAGIGIAIGVLLGVGATALLHSRFYGISAMEWTVLLPVSVVMLAMALLIAYFSARPWIAIDPMEAVRHA